MGKQFLIYGHGGAYNHGGEALIRCGIDALRKKFPGCHIVLSSHFPEQDREFGLPADEIIGCDKSWFAFEKSTNYSLENNDKIYRKTLDCITPQTICIHLGGDNYCYNNWKRYANIHYRAVGRGAKSILWSCSVDPDMIDEEMLEALRTHHLITARETTTYQALKERGISQVALVSDMAFALRPVQVPFDLDNYVSITVGPLVAKRERVPGLMLRSFQRLLDYILDHTDINVALVPHVIMPSDNDYEMMSQLEIRDPSRVRLVAEHYSAAQLKSIIGKARFCVTIRTHASIAAYSSCVPTLVVGYSMKSAAIAKDLGVPEHVLRIENIFDESQIVEAFIRLMRKETEIKRRLSEIMPGYVDNVINDRVLSFDKL